jgi:hypothetical protein
MSDVCTERLHMQTFAKFTQKHICTHTLKVCAYLLEMTFAYFALLKCNAMHAKVAYNVYRIDSINSELV